MDALIRGSIEHFLDNLLEDPKILPSALDMFKKALAPTVKNIEDTLFGYVMGRTIQFAFITVQIYHRRPPTEDEFNEIGQMLTRRAVEIKSKIRLIVNR